MKVSNKKKHTYIFLIQVKQMQSRLLKLVNLFQNATHMLHSRSHRKLSSHTINFLYDAINMDKLGL